MRSITNKLLKRLEPYGPQMPNILTVSRIVIVPLLAWAFFLPDPFNAIVVTLLFALASISDFLDGYLARKWKVESEFGRMMDPIADKLLVLVAITMLIYFRQAHLIPALLILVREIFISGIREYLASNGRSLPVSPLGKWKTTIQMAAVFFLLLSFNSVTLMDINTLGNVLLWFAAGITWLSAYEYMKTIWRVAK